MYMEMIVVCCLIELSIPSESNLHQCTEIYRKSPGFHRHVRVGAGRVGLRDEDVVHQGDHHDELDVDVLHGPVSFF